MTKGLVLSNKLLTKPMKQECELLQTVRNCIASDGSHGWASMKCAVAMLPNNKPLFLTYAISGYEFIPAVQNINVGTFTGNKIVSDNIKSVIKIFGYL